MATKKLLVKISCEIRSNSRRGVSGKMTRRINEQKKTTDGSNSNISERRVSLRHISQNIASYVISLTFVFSLPRSTKGVNKSYPEQGRACRKRKLSEINLGEGLANSNSKALVCNPSLTWTNRPNVGVFFVLRVCIRSKTC